MSGNRVSGRHAIWIIEVNKMQKNTPNLAAGYGVTLGWSIVLPIPKLAAGYGVTLAEKDNGLGTEFSDMLIFYIATNKAKYYLIDIGNEVKPTPT